MAKNDFKRAFSETLVRTGKNYYDSVAALPKGYRMTTQREELRILKSLDSHPRENPAFADIFTRTPERPYAWLWTSTGIRLPEGADPDDHIIIDGRHYWPRQILEGEDVVGEMNIPGDGVVIEWDDKYGLPKKTLVDAERNVDFHSRFWFNNAPQKDPVSGKYDLGVANRSGWLYNKNGYLAIAAYSPRSCQGGVSDSVRLVKENRKVG